MSFGFSAGDCLEGVKLVYNVVNVVADANKAPDEVQWAEESSIAIEGSLERVRDVLAAGQPNSHVTEMNALAQDIVTRETQHRQKRHKRYAETLGQDAARSITRAVPTKMWWRLHGKKDDTRHQNDQKYAVDALNTGVLGHAVEKLQDQLATTERGIAQEEAHHHSIIQRATDIGTDMLRKVEDTGSSVLQQQLVLAGNIDKKLDDISAFLQQQSGVQNSKEETLQRFLQGLEPLLNKVNELSLTNRNDQERPRAPGREPSLATGERHSNPRVELGSHVSHSPGRQQVTSSQRALRAPKRLEAISVLRVYDRSVELAWSSSGASVSTNEGSVCLTLLLLILAACCEIGFEISRRLSSQVSKQRGIPAPVSFLLSDNIHFTDALGRSFKLCLAQTTTWELLQGWLREQFKDCPGSSKVQHGQFFVFDPRRPDQIISASTWSKAVGPRRRFQMGIVYSHTQLSEYCPKCFRAKQKKTPISGGPSGYSIVRCPSCGIVYSTSALDPLRPTLRVLATSLIGTDEEPAGRRKLPYHISLGQAPQGMRYLEGEFSNILKEPSSDDLDLELDLDLGLDLDLETGKFVSRPSWKEEKDTSAVAYSHWERKEYSEDPEEEVIAYGPARDLSEERDEEQRDIAYFTTVWIRKDTRLHDAALRGDCSLAQQLISEGLDPNERTGRSGSPLIAAIVSGSHLVVKLLLDHGADPLLPVQQGHTPVSVAACHATDRVGHLVFPAAFLASYTRPGDFQGAVDRALYESTTKEHEWHDFLLFIGANPTAPCPGPRESAFAKALKAKDNELLKRFLMVLWERKILTRFEAIILVAALRGEDISLNSNPEAWLRVCCASLVAGDAQIFSQEINKRIRRKPDFYFRLNVGNTSCNPDIQRFWRKCENERQGIVVPPDLAGLGV